MSRSIAYSVPIKGMNVGQHQFQFALDGTFFETFENSPVQECDIKLILEADRRHDMILLEFQLEGVVHCPCDRCLAAIQLPVSGGYRIIAKLEEEDTVQSDDEEVIYLNREAPRLYLADFLYDFVCLSVPMVRTYDCDNDNPIPCDLKTRKYMEQGDDVPEDPNPIWDEIKTKLS